MKLPPEYYLQTCQQYRQVFLLSPRIPPSAIFSEALTSVPLLPIPYQFYCSCCIRHIF